MIEPIVVRFATAGIPEVSGAFAQVSKQAAKFEDQTTKASQKGSRDRVGVADREARDRERVASKLAKEQLKLEQQKTRDAEQEAKRRESIVRRSSEMAGKEAEKAANAEIKAKQRATREVEREEARKLRIVIRSSEMAGQAAERAAREEATAAARGAQEAAAARAKYSRGLIGGAGRGLSSLGGTIKGVAGMAAGGMAMMGGFAFADAARKEMSFESTAARLVNAGTTNGVAPGTIADVSAAASREAVITGMSKEQLAGAAFKYSQNARGGDFQGALANMGFFAKLSKVSGADINDIAESAGVLQSQNASLQGKAGQGAMQAMMLNVLAQTHEGSMSFADVAKQMGTLGSTRSFFTADEGTSQRMLMGLGQIARVGGDAGEAGTFVKDIAMEVGMANREYAKKHGGKKLVRTNAHGQMESVEQMVGDVFRGTRGNIEEIGHLFGKRGSALFRELEGSYLGGEKTGGVEGGVKAALANVNQVAGASMSMGQFEDQFKQTEGTPGARLEKATNAITTQMENALTPAMEKLATTLENPEVQRSLSSIVSAVGTVVAYLAENPFKGLGLIVAAKVSSDLAQAGIGAAVKAILTAILAGAATPGGVAGAAGKAIGAGAGYAGAGGAAALGGAALVGAAIGTGTGVALVNRSIAQQNRDQVATVLGAAQASSDAASVQRKARGGTVTAADLSAMKSRANAMADTVEQKRLAIGSNPMGVLQTAMMGLFGGKEGQQFAQDTRADQKAQYEASKKALQDLNAAIKTAADALSAMKSSVPTPPPPVHAGAPAGPIPSRPTM